MTTTLNYTDFPSLPAVGADVCSALETAVLGVVTGHTFIHHRDGTMRPALVVRMYRSFYLPENVSEGMQGSGINIMTAVWDISATLIITPIELSDMGRSPNPANEDYWRAFDYWVRQMEEA